MAGKWKGEEEKEERQEGKRVREPAAPEMALVERLAGALSGAVKG